MWAGDMTGSVASLLPKHEDLSLELLRRVGKLVWGCTSALPHPWGGVESSRSGRDTASKNKGERVGERTRHQPVVSSHTCTLTHKQASHAWTCTHRKKKGRGKETFLFFYVNQISGNEILIPRYFILSGSISPRVSFSLFCLWTSLVLLQIFLVEKLHYLFYNIGCQWERLIFVHWFSYLEKTSMADFPEDFTGPFERLHGRQPLSLVSSFISCNGDWIRDRAGCAPTFQ